MEDAPTLLKIPKSECPDILRLPEHKWQQKSGPVWKTQLFFLNELERSPLGRTFVGKAIRDQPYFNTVGKKFQMGNAYSLTEKKGYSCLCMWTI